MQVFDVDPGQTPTEDDPRREDWGDDLIVFSDLENTGQWIMFDPEDDEVDLAEWR